MGSRGRGIRLLAVVAWSLGSLHAGGSLAASADGVTVYDSANGVTWLADGNLAASNRFGLSVCGSAAIDTKTCINPGGSMSYQALVAWVRAMNAANYLGHNTWQIPTTPISDPTCSFIGPQNNSFGWGCLASAYGSLYAALGLSSPNTAVPVVNIKAGPFNNFQPDVYWSQTTVPQPLGVAGCCATFSFNSGWQGSNITSNILFLLPMIPGKIAGTPAASGTGLQVNPGGQSVYDPVANVTWLADADVAASNTFGLARCKAPGSPTLCVSQNGAMNFNSATQFIENMNAAAYLGQTNWQIPTADPSCASSYSCSTAASLFQDLYYNQLGLTAGTPVVTAPNTEVGPFTGIRPYLYWTCQADKVAEPCGSAVPETGFEWSFWFSNGFQGTDVLAHDMYAMAYFPGTRTAASGPEISEVANAEGESPIIAPNTWVEIKGLNLGPANDSRIWQESDFVGDTMPTQLDQVSATVNGRSAYVYYISPTQINILTPEDALSSPAQVVVTNNGTMTASFAAQTQPASPSFFVLAGGPYVAGVHQDRSLVAPAGLFSSPSEPAKPGETIMLYANGFGPTSIVSADGSISQSGTLSPLPVVQIGGVRANVTFAGLVYAGEFQFNVTVPMTLQNGDQPITATYGGLTTQPGVLIPVHN